jgi:hypothetical protein
MAINVLWSEQKAFRRRLAELKDAANPSGRRVKELRDEIQRAVEKDNVEKLLGYGSSAWAGIDRFDRDLAQPAQATIKSWRLRLGRVLAPEGLASRAITRFTVQWVAEGNDWRMIAGWLGIPWMIYHLYGAAKGSKSGQPNWSLPKRDIGGLSRQGRADVRAAFDRFYADIARRRT